MLDTTSVHRFGSVLVRAVDPGLTRDHVLITFGPLQPTLGAPTVHGFGEPTFARRGLSAIHIIGLENHWYQTASIAEGLACARDLARPFARRVSYGSSMGGYGALRYAEELEVSRVIAASPQWTINPERPPYDTRWSHEMGVLGAFTEDMAERLGGLPEALVLYDPFDPDAAHVALYRDVRPDFTYVPLPFSGHFPMGFLTDLGILGDAVHELVVSPAPDVGALRRQIRARRRESSVYWTGLSSAAERHERQRLALSAADRANCLQPTVDRVVRQVALNLSAGFTDKAFALLRREIGQATTSRDGVVLLSTLAHYLHQAGRPAELGPELKLHVDRWALQNPEPNGDDTKLDELILLGRLQSAAGDWPGVAASMRAVLRKRPEDLEALRTASGAFMMTGHSGSAIFLAQRAVELAPQKGEYQLHLGSLLLSAGALTEALQPLRRAIALGQGVSAYEALADALDRLAQPAAAAQLAREALALFPPTPVLKRLLGSL